MAKRLEEFAPLASALSPFGFRISFGIRISTFGFCSLFEPPPRVCTGRISTLPRKECARPRAQQRSPANTSDLSIRDFAGAQSFLRNLLPWKHLPQLKDHPNGVAES